MAITRAQPSEEIAEAMALERARHLAGCGSQCRIETWFDVERLATVAHHITDRSNATVRILILRRDHFQHWADTPQEQRFIAWLRAQHDAERAFYTQEADTCATCGNTGRVIDVKRAEYTFDGDAIPVTNRPCPDCRPCGGIRWPEPAGG